jgi:hypothetical protein
MMSDDPLSKRQQRAAEAILEDERLTGDLTDERATLLIEWASQRAVFAAANPNDSDEEIDQRVRAIRWAVRHAARTALETDDAKRLVERAEELLTKEI